MLACTHGRMRKHVHAGMRTHFQRLASSVDPPLGKLANVLNRHAPPIGDALKEVLTRGRAWRVHGRARRATTYAWAQPARAWARPARNSVCMGACGARIRAARVWACSACSGTSARPQLSPAPPPSAHHVGLLHVCIDGRGLLRRQRFEGAGPVGVVAHLGSRRHGGLALVPCCEAPCGGPFPDVRGRVPPARSCSPAARSSAKSTVCVAGAHALAPGKARAALPPAAVAQCVGLAVWLCVCVSAGASRTHLDGVCGDTDRVSRLAGVNLAHDDADAAGGAGWGRSKSEGIECVGCWGEFAGVQPAAHRIRPPPCRLAFMLPRVPAPDTHLPVTVPGCARILVAGAAM